MAALADVPSKLEMDAFCNKKPSKDYTIVIKRHWRNVSDATRQYPLHYFVPKPTIAANNKVKLWCKTPLGVWCDVRKQKISFINQYSTS